MSLTLTIKQKAGGVGNVSGEGSTITLQNTLEAPFLKFELKGDTDQTAYSGKNLLDNGFASGTQDGMTVTNNNDGGLTFNGNATTSFRLAYNLATPITLSAGTYTLSSGNKIPSDSDDYWLVVRSSSGEIVSLNMRRNTSNTFTLSNSVTVTQYQIAIPKSTTVLSNVTIFPQLEKGSTATQFEPYVGGTASPNPDYPQKVQTVTGRQVITIDDGGEQSQEYEINLGNLELCKIGDYQDYIYKEDGIWYLHKEAAKYTITGTEGWDLAQSNPNLYYTTDVLTTPAGAAYPKGYSNRFSVVSRYPNQNNNEIAIRGNAGTELMIRCDSVADAAALKTYLQNNQTVLYYNISTPTDTEITDANLLAQLNALSGAQSYDWTTNLTVSGNLPAIMSVEAKKMVYLEKTYTEAELGAPLTISDVEGKSQNTTLNGNIYVDFIYNKKSFTVDIFNLTPSDYATIRAFYDSQFTSGNFPTISIPELDISNMVVFFEISSRNIVNQCLLTDKLTLKFRETVQP